MKTVTETAAAAGIDPAIAEVNSGYLERFAELIRADERKELEQIDWTALMRQGALVTWGDAEELGDRVIDAIRATTKCVPKGENK